MEAIHIVGAGGIGCAVGHALRRGGTRVVFVENTEAKVAHGRRHGVAVEGQGALPAEFVHFRDWEAPSAGVVLLCVKCPANAAVLARVGSASLIPIQNGVDAALAQRGPHVEGIASFVSECPREQTHTRITRRGDLHLGVHGASSPALRSQVERLANQLGQASFRVRIVEDIRPWKYTKLMYNSAISPLAASAGLDNGELLRWPRLRGLFFALLRENHAILRHAGLPLEKVGPLHPATVARILARPWLAHLLAWAFYPSLRGTYCSMAPDLPDGPTEIANYNGHLVKLAGDLPCPLNRAVVSLVERMVAERLPPHPDRLEALWTIELGRESVDLAGTDQRVAG
ncbi:MAG: ketopantoate reductase C-terminal domain-containing protein [Gemmataceae bacterium]